MEEVWLARNISKSGLVEFANRGGFDKFQKEKIIIKSFTIYDQFDQIYEERWISLEDELKPSNVISSVCHDQTLPLLIKCWQIKVQNSQNL